jgi:hypothetical protein
LTCARWTALANRRPGGSSRWEHHAWLITGYNSALRRQLTREFGEQFTEATGPILPLDHYPGDATALQILGHGRFEAIAEPVRLGGGSALVV